MKFLVRFVGISMIIVALYNLWVVIDVPPTFKVLATTKEDSGAIVSLGNDAGQGNLFKFGVAYFTAPSGTKAKDKYAAFAMKAKPIAQTYDEIFIELAREFKVTIVVGSIVLPEHSLDEDGKNIPWGPAQVKRIFLLA